ncbi:MAG: hypothetical protein Q8Q23_05390 [bacterium]|nr:hypothetical protein [bacterium]
MFFVAAVILLILSAFGVGGTYTQDSIKDDLTVIVNYRATEVPPFVVAKKYSDAKAFLFQRHFPFYFEREEVAELFDQFEKIDTVAQ